MVAIEERSNGTNNISVFDIVKCSKLDDLSGGQITVTAGLTITDTKGFVFGTSSGSPIGTATNQKLGFWGVTPIVQPVAATGGGMTVDQLITILQTTGIVKQS